jgi:transcriptional regulator
MPGTLESLVLKTLTHGPLHGYAIARWIEDATSQALSVEEGSLYPALYRMEKRDWIQAEWGTSELGRRAKFYRLTPKGRRQLTSDTEAWVVFAAAVNKVLIPSS